MNLIVLWSLKDIIERLKMDLHIFKANTWQEISIHNI